MPTLRSLDRHFRPSATLLVQVARQLDSGFVVTSARRGYAEQARLYQRFLEGKSSGLPALPPGSSMHELGLAFDLARPGIDPLTDHLLARVGALWKSWGGRWGPSDPVHFQPAMSGTQARALVRVFHRVSKNLTKLLT